MKLQRTLSLALVISLAALAGACAKKTKPDNPESALTDSTIRTDDGKNAHDSDSNSAMGLVTVHFPFDSATIEASEKDALKKDLGILKSNPRLHVQIEGHCDQRGGTQYNLALGERRAKAVMKYLTGMGVGASRVTTISMGKEKPVDPAETEEAYAKNRRANFVLTE